MPINSAGDKCMSEEEFAKLVPGDKVLIVPNRISGMNSAGYMDEWLGKIMTIRDAYGNMIEDNGRWSWGSIMAEKAITKKNKEVF